MKKIITVNEHDIIDLQRCAIDIDSRKELISFMIVNDMDMSCENFKRYETEYQQLFFTYRQYKKYFEKQTLPQYTQEKILSWNLDFESCQVTLEVEDNE